MKSLILFLVVFSFDSFAMSGKPQELQEIKIFGRLLSWRSERNRTLVKNTGVNRGVLKEGETLADKPGRFSSQA